MADFWSKQEDIVTVDKNKREVIKASLCERQDKEYIELRTFTREHEEDTDIKPTKKGIVIPKEMWDVIAEAVDTEVFSIGKEN